MKLVEITFEEILPVWREHLWNGRLSDIKPMSSMTLDRQYDMSIYEKYVPYFCAVVDGKEILGVNSCHQTGNTEFRSRGIYIFPEHRGKGVSKKLFNFVKEKALENNCSTIWSLPRLTALTAYKAAGFEECSEVINEGVEFGPNVYVKLNTI
jgi:GNAT superfamily N-acetyltransferase